MPQEARLIPLVLAAHRAGITYHRMLSVVLRGWVRGERGENGRWTVDPASLSEWMLRRCQTTRRMD